MKTKRKKERIAAVVVTYNRLPLLKKCIDSLRRQTRKLDEIIIVNNDSTDGTREWLKKQKGLFVINQKNLGGAGGFNTGLKISRELGFEWSFLTDDDVKFYPSALEEMISYKIFSKFIHASKIWASGTPFKWHFLFDTKRLIPTSINIINNNSGKYYKTNVACFEGALIHNSIVNQIGYPDIKYFMCGDDTIYGFLASKYTKVICLNKILIEKLVAEPQNGRYTPNFYYFKWRNTFLTYKILHDKNLINLNNIEFLNIISLLFKDIKHTRSWNHLYMIMKGLLHGFKNNFGVPGWI